MTKTRYELVFTSNEDNQRQADAITKMIGFIVTFIGSCNKEFLNEGWSLKVKLKEKK